MEPVSCFRNPTRAGDCDFEYSFSMRLALGFDGGGTKTDCVLMEESGRILGRGRGGPSNPHRIGFSDAERGILEAAKLAVGEAGVKLKDVTEVCAGLAGVGRAENAAEIKKLLRDLLAERFHDWH